jgi:hypothetical protein
MMSQHAHESWGATFLAVWWIVLLLLSFQVIVSFVLIGRPMLAFAFLSNFFDGVFDVARSSNLIVLSRLQEVAIGGSCD